MIYYAAFTESNFTLNFTSNFSITVYPTLFPYLMDKSNVFDDMFRLSNIVMETGVQIKFEANLKDNLATGVTASFLDVQCQIHT